MTETHNGWFSGQDTKLSLPISWLQTLEMAETPALPSLYVIYSIFIKLYTCFIVCLLHLLYLPPFVGPRLPLNEIYRVLVRKESKLYAKHVPHYCVGREKSFHLFWYSCFLFLFFFGSRIPRGCFWCFGLPRGPVFVLFERSQGFVVFSVFGAVVIGLVDATELESHCAATPLPCTNIGALQ